MQEDICSQFLVEIWLDDAHADLNKSLVLSLLQMTYVSDRDQLMTTSSQDIQLQTTEAVLIIA